MIETLKQFAAPFYNWRIWFLMGNQDIRLRYRRSLLGPLWITLSLGATVFGLGLLYGRIFEQDFNDYLFYLTAGFAVWFLFAAMINEGCVMAIEAESQLRSLALPLPVLAARMVYRNSIVFLHNGLVVAAVMLYVRAPITSELLWVIPGSVMILAIGFFAALLLGPVCLRFRDVSQVVASVVQIAFFLTPILWMPTQGRVSQTVVELNPLYHMLELVRAPILGHAPTALNWFYAELMLLTLGVMALISLAVSRKRLYLWL